MYSVARTPKFVHCSCEKQRNFWTLIPMGCATCHISRVISTASFVVLVGHFVFHGPNSLPLSLTRSLARTPRITHLFSDASVNHSEPSLSYIPGECKRKQSECITSKPHSHVNRSPPSLPLCVSEALVQMRKCHRSKHAINCALPFTFVFRLSFRRSPVAPRTITFVYFLLRHSLHSSITVN